jgi:serine/threonine protein kinase
MNTTNCPNPDMLADYVLGRVSEADLSSIASHVEACPACQSQLETMDGLSDTVITCLRHAAAADEADSADDSLLNEVLSKIESITSASGSDSHDHVHEAVLPLQIGQYRLVEKLGQGSMGAVYKAFHTKLKRTVAVKLLPEYRQRSPQAVIRFHREMEAVGRVDHPNIVRAHDAGEADGQFFLVMEFVEGVTLSSLMHSVGRLDVANACDIVRQAAVGLQHAHEHGLVHRDVKPSNLMLTTTGVVKVLDLGLARLQVEVCSDGDATGSGQIMGTADYMAPEQGSNPRDADARADVYALGCTLYFFLAGRPPFGDQRHSTFLEKVIAHANEDVVPIDRIRPDVPTQLVALLNRMLAKSPADRCSTAAEVAESLAPLRAGSDLVGLLTGQGAVAPIPPTAPSTTDSYLPDRPPKSPEVSAVPGAASTHKAWLIGLGLALLAILVMWYGIGFLPRQWAGDKPPPRPLLSGTIDARVWNTSDSSRRGLSLKEAVPLRPNDWLRIEAQLNRPAYVYVVWIDSQGRASPVYPWTPGDWASSRSSESPIDRLSLPPEGDEGWPVRGPGGVETLLLLAREEPLPAEFQLCDRLSDLPRQQANKGLFACFDDGRLVTEAIDHQRGLGLSEQGRISDEVLKVQRLIHIRLASYFTLIRAVNCVSLGSEKP